MEQKPGSSAGDQPMTTVSDEARRHIGQEIAAYNAARSPIAAEVKKRRWIALGGTVVGTAALAAMAFVGGDSSSFSIFMTAAIFLFIAGGLFGWYWAGRPAANAQDATRERIFPVLFAMVEDLRYTRQQTPDCFAGLPGAAIGSYRTSTFGDCIAGRYKGAQIELFEGLFTRKTNKSTTTVFQGVIVGFDLPQEFAATLVASARRFALFGAIGDAFSSLKAMETGNAALDGIYEIRTDNVAAALPLVQGEFARALGRLAGSWNDNLPRVALAGWSGYVLLPSSKDWLELPSIFTELDYAKHVEPLLGELVHLLDTALDVRESLKQ